jgi:uncharacterized protein (TIGR02246 family)
MRSWIICAALVASGLTAMWAGGQNAAQQNDEAGLRKAVEAYGAALQAGDLNAILALWTPDADYIDEDGQTIRGRDAIGALYKDSLADYKASKVSAKINAIRFLTPDVAVMDGVVESTSKDGDSDRNHFSATWTRTGGKWMIASARSLPETPADMAERGMTELKWLIGDWVAESGDTKIKLSVKPDLGNKFLRMEFQISAKEPITVVQYVGWDPIEGAVRTWTLDSRGGFGNGLWTRNASMWVGETEGFLPTGQVATAVAYMRTTGPNSFVWQATEREVDGQPIPDNEIKYTRAAATH